MTSSSNITVKLRYSRTSVLPSTTLGFFDMPARADLPGQTSTEYFSEKVTIKKSNAGYIQQKTDKKGGCAGDISTVWCKWGFTNVTRAGKI
jgi:hypothetical protein